MPWIANPNSDSLDIGTVLAIGNSDSPSGHRPVLKVGDELLDRQDGGRRFQSGGDPEIA